MSNTLIWEDWYEQAEIISKVYLIYIIGTLNVSQGANFSRVPEQLGPGDERRLVSSFDLQRLVGKAHYTLPAKNMEYFLFQWLFAFLWGVHGVSALEIHPYEQILLWGKLIST